METVNIQRCENCSHWNYLGEYPEPIGICNVSVKLALSNFDRYYDSTIRDFVTEPNDTCFVWSEK